MIVFHLLVGLGLTGEPMDIEVRPGPSFRWMVDGGIVRIDASDLQGLQDVVDAMQAALDSHRAAGGGDDQ